MKQILLIILSIISIKLLARPIIVEIGTNEITYDRSGDSYLELIVHKDGSSLTFPRLRPLDANQTNPNNVFPIYDNPTDYENELVFGTSVAFYYSTYEVSTNGGEWVSSGDSELNINMIQGTTYNIRARHSPYRAVQFNSTTNTRVWEDFTASEASSWINDNWVTEDIRADVFEEMFTIVVVEQEFQTGFETTFCHNADNFNISDFLVAESVGENLSITGSAVSNDVFIPSLVTFSPNDNNVQTLISIQSTYINGVAVDDILMTVKATYDDQSISLGNIWSETKLDFCSDDNSLNLTDLVQFNDSGDFFSWNGGTGNSFDPTVYPNVTEIIYTFTNGNFCTTDHTIPVNVDPAFTVDISSNSTQYCIDAMTSLTATPFGGEWRNVDGGIDGSTFTPSEAGVGAHTLVYTISQGTCTKESTIDINVFALPPVETGGDLEFCNNTGGDQNLIRTNTFPQSGGSWSIVGNPSVNGRIDNGTQEFNIDGLANGEYLLQLDYTDGNNCSNSDQTIIKIQDVLNAPIVSESFSCEPSQITLQIASPQNNVVYQWSDDTTQAIDFTGTSYLTEFLNTSKSYFVSVENEFGCVSSYREVFAEIRSVIAPNPGTDTTICFNSDPFILTGFSPLNGTFTGSGVSNIGENQWLYDPTGLPSAGYTVNYSTIINGCPSSSSRFIAIREAVGVEAGFAQSVCFGDSLFVGNNEFPTNGSWSFENQSLNSLLDSNELGETILDASILEVNDNGYPLIYTATDDFGCEGTDLSSVFVRALPNVPSVPNTTSCGSDFVSLEISNYDANITYQWFDDELKNTLLQDNNLQRYQPTNRVDSTTSYFVMATNGSGCISDLVETQAIIYALPEFDVTNQIVCLNNQTYDLNEAVSVTGGLFYDNPVTSIIASTIFPNSSGEGSTVYNYEIENSFGCTTRKPFQVTVVASLAGNLLPNDTSFCRSLSPFSLNEWAGLSDGTFSGPGVEFNFIDLSNVNDPDNLITVSYQENDNGCVFQDQVDITILSSPDVPEIKGDAFGCFGETLEFFEDEGTNLTYEWRVNGDTEISSSDQNINVVVGQAETVNLLVYNTIGCSSSESDQITIIDNTPTGTISVSDSSIISGDLVTFDFSGTVGSDVEWSFSNGGGDQGTQAKHYFYSDSAKYQNAQLLLIHQGCTKTLVFDSVVFVSPEEIPIISNNDDQSFNGKNSNSALFIYPTLATDFITLDYPNGNISDLTVMLFDLRGMLLLESKMDNNILDISNLPNGSYTLKVFGNDENLTTNIIKR